MTHFSPAEFVDAADGTLASSRAAHLERCARCAAHAAIVREATAAARTAEVPEPSPLYWSHLRARIRERVAGESIAPAWRAISWRDSLGVRTVIPVASALALVAAVVVGGTMIRHAPPPAPDQPGMLAQTRSSEPAIEIEDSEVWQVLTSAAADVPIEEAHAAGLGVRSGAVDAAVQRMSPEELTELSRLLQSELQHPGD